MAEAAERVDFDFLGSLRLARTLHKLATDIEADGAARETAAATAKEKWLGAYGDEFVDRRSTERTKERNIVSQLKGEADQWAQAWAGAVNQQLRNNRAAQVEALAKKKKDDRNLIEKGSDGLGFTDDDSFEEANEEVPAAKTVGVPQGPHYKNDETERCY